MPFTTINGYRHFYEDVGRGEPIDAQALYDWLDENLTEDEAEQATTVRRLHPKREAADSSGREFLVSKMLVAGRLPND